MEKVTRFIGIDQSKKSFEAAIVCDESTGIKRAKYKTTHSDIIKFISTLKETDIVGLETGNNAFRLAKQIIKKAHCKTHVLNAGSLNIIFRSLKKTDQEDALRIARFIQRVPEEELPTVTIPSDEEMAMRSLSTQSILVNGVKTEITNSFHALLWNNGITEIKRNEMKKKSVRIFFIQKLPEAYKSQALRMNTHIEFLEEQIKEIEDEQKVYLKKKKNETLISMSMPGVGIQTAFVIQAFLGKMNERFENAKQVSFYSGFTPRIDSSGQINRNCSITKRGPRQIRRVMTQAAWAALKSNSGSELKSFFENVASRRGNKRAIVALSRKMLEILYVLHSRKEFYNSVSCKDHDHVIKKFKRYGLLKESA
ncbi:MAG: IS110 family transposase [Candidatus Pacebacteria bacterium]|nr:IS110 family transposase [Candidatus Paceibacterota bacterium]